MLWSLLNFRAISWLSVTYLYFNQISALILLSLHLRYKRKLKVLNSLPLLHVIFFLHVIFSLVLKRKDCAFFLKWRKISDQVVIKVEYVLMDYGMFVHSIIFYFLSLVIIHSIPQIWLPKSNSFWSDNSLGSIICLYMFRFTLFCSAEDGTQGLAQTC